MTQGESQREKVKRALLFVAADRRHHKSGDFVKALKGQSSKNTVYKYLKELVSEKLMKVEPGSAEESFKPKYSVTPHGLEKVNEQLKKDKSVEVTEWFAKMNPVEAKFHLERALDRIMQLQRIVSAKDQRIRDDMTRSIMWLRVIQKLNQLSGKELEAFSAKEYMEELKSEHERREAAMEEYAKMHPELVQRLRQNFSREHYDEYAEGFEEYYKREFCKGRDLEQ